MGTQNTQLNSAHLSGIGNDIYSLFTENICRDVFIKFRLCCVVACRCDIKAGKIYHRDTYKL